MFGGSPSDLAIDGDARSRMGAPTHFGFTRAADRTSVTYIIDPGVELRPRACSQDQLLKGLRPAPEAYD